MLTVLIIDDDEAKASHLENVTRDALSDVELKIIKVLSVSEASEVLRKEVVDLALLDVMLPIRRGEPPKRDGCFVLLHQIKAGKLRRPRNIIGVTSHAELFSEFKLKFEEDWRILLNYAPSSAEWEQKLRDHLLSVAQADAGSNWAHEDKTISNFDREGFGLTLSGGGFRATLFHLGAIQFMFQAQCSDGAKLLSKVKRICSVSGGSVTAAHIVLNWEYLLKSEENFAAIAAELINFVRSDVRGQIIRRNFIGYLIGLNVFGFRKFSRTEILRRAYQKFYRFKSLSALQGVGRPHLRILCTSMTNGRMCSFDAGGFAEFLEDGNERRIPGETYPIGSAVAASSAFPPLFEPLEVAPTDFAQLLNEVSHPHYLTDAGVFDNSGIAMMNWLQENQLALSTVFVSDAGAPFDWDLKAKYRFITSRTIRTTDILMQRIATLEKIKLTINAQRVEAVECRIKGLIPIKPTSLDSYVQQRVRMIRTDLDSFSLSEIYVLIKHGYEVAMHQWQKRFPSGSWAVEAPEFHELNWPKFGIDLSSTGLKKALSNCHKHRFGIWSWTDLASWILWLLILVYLSGLMLWMNRRHH